MFEKNVLGSPNLLIRMLVLAAMLCATPLLAADLQQAKAQGHLGETPSGYLGLVDAGAPADVKALMAEVNSKRKAHYQSIAQRNSASLQSVEAQAGRKAMDMTPPGQYIQTPAGVWVKK